MLLDENSIFLLLLKSKLRLYSTWGSWDINKSTGIKQVELEILLPHWSLNSYFKFNTGKKMEACLWRVVTCIQFLIPPFISPLTALGLSFLSCKMRVTVPLPKALERLRQHGHGIENSACPTAREVTKKGSVTAYSFISTMWHYSQGKVNSILNLST